VDHCLKKVIRGALPKRLVKAFNRNICFYDCLVIIAVALEMDPNLDWSPLIVAMLNPVHDDAELGNAYRKFGLEERRRAVET